MAEMSRDALLLYLRDIRDLEIAKRTITNMYNQEDWNFRQEYRRLTVPQLKEEPVLCNDDVAYKAIIPISAIGAIIVFVCGLDALKRGEWGLALKVFFFGMIATMLIGVVLGKLVVYEELQQRKDTIRKQNQIEYDRANSSIEREKANQVMIAWQKKNNYYKAEYEKVEGLLASYYSMNIIPSQFRNLAAVYYLYDYMSTSQETLRDALLQRTLTDGIQRILDRLDAVIASVQDVATQTRILEAQNQTLINNNQRMIRSLQNVETNTAVAASYAGLASNYAKANAYFSLATYLKS